MLSVWLGWVGGEFNSGLDHMSAIPSSMSVLKFHGQSTPREAYWTLHKAFLTIILQCSPPCDEACFVVWEDLSSLGKADAMHVSRELHGGRDLHNGNVVFMAQDVFGIVFMDDDLVKAPLHSWGLQTGPKAGRPGIDVLKPGRYCKVQSIS